MGAKIAAQRAQFRVELAIQEAEHEAGRRENGGITIERRSR